MKGVKIIDKFMNEYEPEDLAPAREDKQTERSIQSGQKDNQGKQTEKKAKRDRRDVVIVILSVITLISVIAAVWALFLRSYHAPASASGTNVAGEVEQPEKMTDSIALPQFAWLTFASDVREQTLTFASDVREQTLTFTNPERNFACFRVSIVLDGETLWQSELLKPGEMSGQVVLSRALSAGEYEARLVYECFTDDEAQNPLNGADSPITLKVY